MTREAVSAAKPAVRAQAKTEKVHGAASAAVLKGLVYGAAVLTFAVLLFLIGYILVTGIPHLKPSLFQWNYTSENVSMMPAILHAHQTGQNQSPQIRTYFPDQLQITGSR